MQTLRRRFASFTLIALISGCCSQPPTIEHTKRDVSMRKLFQSKNPCPSTGKTYGACPGYVVDHIIPLKRGGGDNPYNMQWQSVDEAKAKDKWE